MAKDNMSWLDSLTKPSRRGFNQYLRSQKGQFTPLIGTLLNQLRSTKVSDDPTVKSFESLLKGLPSSEKVSSEYGSRLANLSSYIQGLDTAKGGRAVSDIVSGLGSALGVEGAGDVASAAGTVSGVGGLGGDVINKALMMGAQASFGGLEADRLAQLAGQRQELTLGAGQARSAVQQQRQELGRMIAEARGQRAAATPNPFELASMVMQYQDAMKARSGTGRTGKVKDRKPKTPKPDLSKQKQYDSNVAATASEWLQGAGSGIFGS